MGYNPTKSKAVYEETATLVLKDPNTGDELEVDGAPVTITVLGQAHPKHLKAVETIKNANDKRVRQGKTASLHESREESINFLATISVTSENLEDDDEQPITTKEQFKVLYGNNTISWIRDQVSEFAGKDVNFLKK